MTAFFTILSAAVTLVVLTASAATTFGGTSVHFSSIKSRLLQKIEQPELLALFRAIILYRFLKLLLAVCWRQVFL
jgi:hypothetical protein